MLTSGFEDMGPTSVVGFATSSATTRIWKILSTEVWSLVSGIGRVAQVVINCVVVDAIPDFPLAQTISSQVDHLRLSELYQTRWGLIRQIHLVAEEDSVAIVLVDIVHPRVAREEHFLLLAVDVCREREG